jgi:hypothetical protein
MGRLNAGRFASFSLNSSLARPHDRSRSIGALSARMPGAARRRGRHWPLTSGEGTPDLVFEKHLYGTFLSRDPAHSKQQSIHHSGAARHSCGQIQVIPQQDPAQAGVDRPLRARNTPIAEERWAFDRMESVSEPHHLDYRGYRCRSGDPVISRASITL